MTLEVTFTIRFERSPGTVICGLCQTTNRNFYKNFFIKVIVVSVLCDLLKPDDCVFNAKTMSTLNPCAFVRIYGGYSLTVTDSLNLAENILRFWTARSVLTVSLCNSVWFSRLFILNLNACRFNSLSKGFIYSFQRFPLSPSRTVSAIHLDSHFRSILCIYRILIFS